MADPSNSVSVGAGALTVTGYLTKFVAAEGDLLVINGVSAVIASRTSSTALSLKKGWPGPPINGETAWDILPTGPYWQSNVATSRKLSDLLRRFDAGPIKWDASGPFSERKNYNNQPKDFVFLSYSPSPFTLYVKTSSDNAETSWSAGQVIQGVEAESTAQAKASAAEAAASGRQALEQASMATTQAGYAAAQRAAADAARGSADQSASRANASASEAAFLASLVGALSYDMGTLSDASSGSTNFDFGSL